MNLSRQNPLIKQIRSLSDKKNRDELGLYIAEGVKLVNEAIDSSQNVQLIIGVSKALSQIKEHNFRVEEVSEEVFSAISTEKNPQGVLALIHKPSQAFALPKASCVLLDGVSDPTNVGAIIRTAAAAGFNQVYLTLDSADCFNSKAVRASMSGIYKVQTHLIERNEVAEKIKLPIIVADMEGENVFDFSPKQDFCLVIGNEGKGVSKTLMDLASHTVNIPMQNQMESLNASVSAGILMYLLKNK